MAAVLIAIPILPLAAFAVLVAFGRRMGRVSAYVSIGAITASAGLGYYALSVAATRAPVDAAIPWFEIGAFKAVFGVRLDALSALMLVIVGTVSLLVHVYSIGYMAGEKRYSTYFAYLSLFSAAMLMLVAANNFLWLYICWELVGLCSYLLIGYYIDRPAAGDAAKKAFITTRIGDVGLLVAILAIYFSTGSFRFTEVFSRVASGSGSLGPPELAVTVAGLLLFAGSIGKSAQFPLHVWLPDAMEGPTTASALIHAATMVAAGVYLVARAYPVLSSSAVAMQVIAVVGLFTSLMAATIAVAQTDAKRILAYSTISQLGLMFLAVGTGAWVAGIFHLMTHAFFKALLFLSIGSVIHGTGKQDIREIAGVWPRMRVTAITFACGALALAAVPPFAGFFSKDEILANLFATGRYWMFGVALLISFLTALYVWRLGFVAIFAPGAGEGDAARVRRGGGVEAHESPLSMTGPLVLLAVAAFGVGWLGSPLVGAPLQRFFDEPAPHISMVPLLLSVLAALAGIGAAWWGYGAGRTRLDDVLRRRKALYDTVAAGYRVDALYVNWIVRPIVGGARWVYDHFDKGFVDGVVNGVGGVAGALGGLLRGIQTGRVRDYTTWMIGGAVLLAAILAVVIGR